MASAKSAPVPTAPAGKTLMSTHHAYDTLGNLTTVTQGAQIRTFACDALSRLKQATNPESGTISYSYDPNGNLTSKTDARSIGTTYSYDALNRVTFRNYSDSTPDVTYTYDNKANAYGKLTKVSSSVSATEYTAFDILGRVTAHKQTTDGFDYTTGYSYNLSGQLLEQTYPSGRVVKNTFDTGDGSLSQVESKRSTETYRNFANGFIYNPAGAVTAVRLGNGRWENNMFNSRLQPTKIGLGNGVASQDLLRLEYSYGTTANNGNVVEQKITVPGAAHPFVQAYAYDELNRLASAEETQNNSQTWKQTFTYDRYGNRYFNTSNNNTTTLPPGFAPEVYNPTVNTANNRFAGGQSYSYDDAGNTTADAEGRTFTYDAENKQIEVVESGVTVGEYSYDGDGKRVKKHVPTTGETTVFVYDAAWKLIGEYSTVVQTGTAARTVYTTSDHLGSPRINTDGIGQIVSRHDYHPFGEEVSRIGYGSDLVRKQFTGYERDGETGLDFAEARYYYPDRGRFTTGDPLLASGRTGVPQSWNRYVYVLNNPLNYVDPDGLYECKGLTAECKDFRRNLASAQGALTDIEIKYGSDSEEYKQAKKAVDSYGCESKGGNCLGVDGKPIETGKDSNGNPVYLKDTASNVQVSFSWTGNSPAHTSLTPDMKNVVIQFAKGQESNLGLIANEGIDSANMQSAIKTGKSVTQYESDRDGLFVQAVFNELRASANGSLSAHFNLPNNGRVNYWEKGWETADHATVRSNRNTAIDKVLTDVYKIGPKDRRSLVTFPKGYKPKT